MSMQVCLLIMYFYTDTLIRQVAVFGLQFYQNRTSLWVFSVNVPKIFKIAFLQNTLWGMLLTISKPEYTWISIFYAAMLKCVFLSWFEENWVWNFYVHALDPNISARATGPLPLGEEDYKEWKKMGDWADGWSLRVMFLKWIYYF